MKQIEGYDVVVVGGGPGGVGAAVTAGRSGAKTLLIEREGCLGGGMTTMYVHPFMSHFSRGDETTPRRVVNAGLFSELQDRMVARDAIELREGGGPRFDDEPMKLVLDDLVTEAGVDVIFHAALFDVEVDGPHVTGCYFAHNGGPIHVTGKYFIDGTGDCLLADRAGCEILVGDEAGHVMPMTMNFAVAGEDLSRPLNGQVLREMIPKGDKDEPALINTHFSTAHRTPSGLTHFNAIRIPGDTLDVFDVSRAEIEGRRRVENFVAWLKANVPGFENCYLMKTGAHVGIRESRRVVGDYMLTENDWHRCARFDDAVACCSYGIDIHGQKPGQTRLEKMPPGEYFQIPYRSLTPKHKQNLLVASRGISADIGAHSSLRIMPVVMNIGEAAGYAAALAREAGDTRSIDIDTLQRKIRDAGGSLEPWPVEKSE